MKNPYCPKAVDALLDHVSKLQRDLESMRTQMRNAEDVMACVITQYGDLSEDNTEVTLEFRTHQLGQIGGRRLTTRPADRPDLHVLVLS